MMGGGSLRKHVSKRLTLVLDGTGWIRENPSVCLKNIKRKCKKIAKY